MKTDVEKEQIRKIIRLINSIDCNTQAIKSSPSDRSNLSNGYLCGYVLINKFNKCKDEDMINFDGAEWCVHKNGEIDSLDSGNDRKFCPNINWTWEIVAKQEVERELILLKLEGKDNA